MSVPKKILLGGWYPRGLIVHQQRYQPSDSNKIITYVDLPTFIAKMLNVSGSQDNKIKARSRRLLTLLTLSSVRQRDF